LHVRHFEVALLPSPKILFPMIIQMILCSKKDLGGGRRRKWSLTKLYKVQRKTSYVVGQRRNWAK